MYITKMIIIEQWCKVSFICGVPILQTQFKTKKESTTQIHLMNPVRELTR